MRSSGLGAPPGVPGQLEAIGALLHGRHSRTSRQPCVDAADNSSAAERRATLAAGAQYHK